MKWLRFPPVRQLLFLLLLSIVLLLADDLCYATTLPVDITIQHSTAIIRVGTTRLTVNHVGTVNGLQFATQDPVIHEYQIDGTDSTNNFTLDTNYLHTFESSPYYRFQAWMRNLNGTSKWRDLIIQSNTSSLLKQSLPVEGHTYNLPSATVIDILVQVQRPETPISLDLYQEDSSVLHITLDRNDRTITVTRDNITSFTSEKVASAYFPDDSAPFAAMVLDTLLRSMLCAVFLLFFVIAGNTILIVIQSRWPRFGNPSFVSEDAIEDVIEDLEEQREPTLTLRPVRAARKARTLLSYTSSFTSSLWQNLTDALHPVALFALFTSFLFVSWIAAVQYHGEPHIFDASAYFFAAKMYALGHLSVPLPPAADRFPGPFMLQYNGRWFGQYAPGTALTLVPGIWLGVPWIVEPLLGTFALLGIGLLAARLYSRNIATLTVILGALSPFYTYLAASYLSHTVALFYLVWGMWSLFRFSRGKAAWNMALAAVCFGMAFLTRDLVALLFVAILLPGILLLSWRSLYKERERWLRGIGIFLTIAFLFFWIGLGFNFVLTGNVFITPRSLFFAGDHWGFGPGVGFYGEHTLAAGFVNLDELLTILAIDLYGWPFYFSFAFLAIPFLTRRAKSSDWLFLVATCIMTGAYIGYFYHGIYLGPRYLYETLPFLLILTARGIVALAETEQHVRAVLTNHLKQRQAMARQIATYAPVMTWILVVALVSCNVLYYMPRQVTIYQNYNGLPAGTSIDLDAIYHSSLQNAIVVTSDNSLYQFVLFPLNDPYLHDSVIYAEASTPGDYAELRKAFPGRTLYTISVGVNGAVLYTPVSG